MSAEHDFIGLGQCQTRDPNAHPTDPRGVKNFWSNGLTKREYFAGLVLPALIEKFGYVNEGDLASLAVAAIKIADALLLELAKTTKD